MKSRLAATLAVAMALAGCRDKEITPHDRELAASDLSEAQFAVTLQDWPRAEDLFAKAAALVPDDGDTWMNLGVARMRRHDPSGAKSAYKSALAAFKAAYKRKPDDPTPVFNEVTVLVLLGRVDDARDLVSEAAAKHPDDRRLKSFIEAKQIDRILARPGIKDLSP